MIWFQNTTLSRNAFKLWKKKKTLWHYPFKDAKEKDRWILHRIILLFINTQVGSSIVRSKRVLHYCKVVFLDIFPPVSSNMSNPTYLITSLNVRRPWHTLKNKYLNSAKILSAKSGYPSVTQIIYILKWLTFVTNTNKIVKTCCVYVYA